MSFCQKKRNYYLEETLAFFPAFYIIILYAEKALEAKKNNYDSLKTLGDKEKTCDFSTMEKEAGFTV